MITCPRTRRHLSRAQHHTWPTNTRDKGLVVLKGCKSFMTAHRSLPMHTTIMLTICRQAKE